MSNKLFDSTFNNTFEMHCYKKTWISTPDDENVIDYSENPNL